MVDPKLLIFNNPTLIIVTPATNDCFDLNIVTYKKVWNNCERDTLKKHLSDSYGINRQLVISTNLK